MLTSLCSVLLSHCSSLIVVLIEKIKMPRRCNDGSLDDGPPRKKHCSISTSSFDLKHGEFLKDISGKKWKLGKPVGIGAFGEIYLASDNLTKDPQVTSSYVAKIEDHKDGPLFVEINCYLRIAKPHMIQEWKRQKRMRFLGMPHYVASGSHIYKNERYRFLIIPRFDRDLEKVLQDKKLLNIKTVLSIASQIIDVLEYIHSKGYIHSDIKASNILLNNKNHLEKASSSSRVLKHPMRTCRIKKINAVRTTRNLRPQPMVKYLDDIPHFDDIVPPEKSPKEFTNLKMKDQVYLLDYGLACKYLKSNGQHKPFCIDERKAHAGTILFCSRDAHKGVPSRRSDLESLGYNMIYWLTGDLPWSNDVDSPEIVDKKKQRSMCDLEYFLTTCFTDGYPMFLLDYFKYLQKLQFQDKPDYNYCKSLFKNSIKTGFRDDSFGFENLQKRKKKQNILRKGRENIKAQSIMHGVSRTPLRSNNIPIKPVLRKKIENKKVKKRINWFETLKDPEMIFRQSREKKQNTENDSNVTSIAEMNISRLNPTYAMIEVYNKCRERIDASPLYKSECCVENINGYTPAMMSVLENIKKRKVEEEHLDVHLNGRRNGKIVRRCIGKRKKKIESLNRSPPQTRTTKSTMVIKKENFHLRKIKSVVLRRTYSLRG